jgi:hypothetical protein
MMADLEALPLAERRVILGRREWELRLDVNLGHAPKLPDVIVLNGVRYVSEEGRE